MLHIFYPELEYRRAWQNSVYPSLGFVAVALPVVMLLAATTASQDRPAHAERLQDHVDQHRGRDFRQMELTDRDDEIRAAARRSTAWRRCWPTTKIKSAIRSGCAPWRGLAAVVAHQLRNSATGCSMALDSARRGMSHRQVVRSLHVAKRQLQLMKRYIQRFLQLGKPAEQGGRRRLTRRTRDRSAAVGAAGCPAWRRRPAMGPRRPTSQCRLSAIASRSVNW